MISSRNIVKYQAAHDEYLDTAARKRRWDSIHTAALRAGYPGPYQSEGLAFAQWMDQCNVIGYQVLADIAAGNISLPASVEDYLALLPAPPDFSN